MRKTATGSSPTRPAVEPTERLEHLGFPIWHPALTRADRDGRPAIVRGLTEFREHLGGELTVTLLTAIGAGVEVHEIDAGVMLQASGWLRAREGGYHGL